MGALRTWLGLEAWTRFAHEHYGKQPFSMPCVAPDVLSACDWQNLGAALASPAASVQVTRYGELLSVAPPQTLADLHQLFDRDAGIALANADRASESVRAIAEGIGQDVPGNRRATFFATPVATHSLAWHFDLDDLFIVQIAGTKTHQLRENTVARRPLAHDGHSLAAFALETSPVLTCELRAGDLLYVPAGYWHIARAKQTSLSISVGVLGGHALAQQPASSEQRAALRKRVKQVRERLQRARASAGGDTLDRQPTLRRPRHSHHG